VNVDMQIFHMVRREYVLTICAVEIFMEWLYTTTLPDASEKWFEKIDLAISNKPTVEERAKLSMILLKGYVFGDRFMVPAFRSAMLENLVEEFLPPNQRTGSSLAFVHLVKYAYDNVPAGSAVLQYLVDEFCRSW
jgi:hypothetical protein